MKQVLVIFLGAVLLVGCSTNDCKVCKKNGNVMREICNDGTQTNGYILSQDMWESYVSAHESATGENCY